MSPDAKGRLTLQEMKDALPDPAWPDMLHALLGCKYGHGLSFNSDPNPEPCQAQAVQIIVLYQDDDQFRVEVCAEHRDVILENTTTHDSTDATDGRSNDT